MYTCERTGGHDATKPPKKKKAARKTSSTAPSAPCTVECELRAVQRPEKYAEITRWVVRAPTNFSPAPFRIPDFVFAPTKLLDVTSPFLVVRARIATTSMSHDELVAFQEENDITIPDRFVPPAVLASKRYFPNGGKPAQSYVDGPTAAIRTMRAKAKNVSSGAIGVRGSKVQSHASRLFDLSFEDAYISLGLGNTRRTTGIRTKPIGAAPRWWIQAVLGVECRPSNIPANMVVSFCKEWNPSWRAKCSAIMASTDMKATDTLPEDTMIRLAKLRTSSTDTKCGRMLRVLRELERMLREPLDIVSVGLCAFYPRNALVGLSARKRDALVSVFATRAEHTAFSAPVYFCMPPDVVFRAYECQALGLVPLSRFSNAISVTPDEIELYRKALYSAWYRGDVIFTLPETLESDQEREARTAKEDTERIAARKRKARKRRLDEGIPSDDEDINMMLSDEACSDDGNGDDDDDEIRVRANRTRRDKFVVARDVAVQRLIDSGRFIPVDEERVAISEYLTVESELAVYLRNTPARISVVENLRSTDGYRRYLGHAESADVRAVTGTVLAFAVSQAEAERFNNLSAITTRCYTLLKASTNAVEIDVLLVIGAERFGNGSLLKLLQCFTVTKHLVFIGNTQAWRDPRYLGTGQPFHTLFETACSYPLDVIDVHALSEDDLGNVPECGNGIDRGSPALLIEACQYRRWSADVEEPSFVLSEKKARSIFAVLSADADIWPTVQVFKSGTVSDQLVRTLCIGPVPPFDSRTAKIQPGQRLYLRDTGERMTVACCGVGATTETMAMWDTAPGTRLARVSSFRTDAIVEATLPLAREHCKAEYCGCTTNRANKRFFPHRHNVVDGSCINIRQYSGGSMDIAFLIAGANTCRKDLFTLAGLAQKQCFIVVPDAHACVPHAVVMSSRTPFSSSPTTLLSTLIAGIQE